MTRLTKELMWVLGTMFSALAIGLVLFGNTLFNGKPLDLQVHDTYYVFPKAFYIAFIWTLVLISVYALRTLYKKSNNRIINTSITIVLILLLARMIPYWSWMYGYVKDMGYYSYNQNSPTDRISEFTITHWTLTIIMMLVGLIILITIYKTIRPL